MAENQLRDKIDFCCSPTFASHYAKEGLTADYPLDYHLLPLQERLQKLEDIVFSEGSTFPHKSNLPSPDVAVVKRQVQELKSLVLHLEKQLNKHVDAPKQRKSRRY